MPYDARPTMRRALLLAASLFLALALGPAPSVRAKEAPAGGVIAAGSPWETRYHVVDSGRKGPTVMIVGGVHGDEPAGAFAAEQILHWRLRRGRLVVLPRANVTALAAGTRSTPYVPKAQQNLNRNYPVKKADESPRGELAQAIWDLVVRTRPDWLIDLHEGTGIYRVNRKSVGRSIIVFPSRETEQAADHMLEAVNAALPDPRRHFIRLRSITGTLVYAAGKHLGAHAMILETSREAQHQAVRTRRHRVMLHRLLGHLRMLDPSVTVETLTPPREGDGRTVVGLYDSGGVGGPGVPYVARILSRSAVHVVTRVCAEDIRRGVLDHLDVVVFSGGSGSGQAKSLGETGRRAVTAFVRRGGGFVGICAGAYLAASGFSWGLGILDAKTVSPKWQRGRATLKIELTDEGRALFGEAGLGGGRTTAYVRYHNGPIYEPAAVIGLPDYEPLALYRTEVAENGTPRGIMLGSPAVVAGTCGKGRVVCFGPHPEQTPDLNHLVPRAIEWAAMRNEAAR